MSEIEKCRNILFILSDQMKYWGKYIDEFIQSFSQLSTVEIDNLRVSTDSRVKFSLMAQVLEQIRRNFHDFDEPIKRKYLNQLYLLVIFENCDFDIRESILQFNSFDKVTKEDMDLKIDEWNKVSALASPDVITLLIQR